MVPHCAISVALYANRGIIAVVMTMSTPQTSWGRHALSQLFGSDVRAAVLSWICTNAEDLIVGAKLARELDMSPSAVGTELARLERLGMLEATEPIGAAKPYRVSPHFPLLPGLCSMVMYATGVIAALREAFANDDDIELAFIFGSIAAGDDRPNSDVDVVIVGPVSGVRLSQLLSTLEDMTGREINTVHYSREEFAQKVASRGGFLSRVLAGTKIFLKGDEDVLRGLGAPPASAVG